MLSDAIDGRRVPLAGLLADCRVGGRGIEILAIAILPELVSGAAYAPFLLADDGKVEAEDKLCDAVRNLIRGDGGGRVGICTEEDGNGAGEAVTLLGRGQAAWLISAGAGEAGGCVNVPSGSMEGLSIVCTAYEAGWCGYGIWSRGLTSDTCPICSGRKKDCVKGRLAAWGRLKLSYDVSVRA